jgi:hypothetical protein
MGGFRKASSGNDLRFRSQAGVGKAGGGALGRNGFVGCPSVYLTRLPAFRVFTADFLRIQWYKLGMKRVVDVFPHISCAKYPINAILLGGESPC